MEQLLLVRDGVGDALAALGDGNWKMGDGVRVANSSKLGVGSEQILLEHYICRFLPSFFFNGADHWVFQTMSSTPS